jgi:hypothetical protein
MRRFFLVIACLYPLSAFAAPDSFPSFGILSNAHERDFFQYSCAPPSARGLVCQFTQIKVHNIGKPEELAKALAATPEVQKDISSGKSAQVCAEMRKLVDALHRGKAPPGSDQAKFFSSITSQTPRERADMLRGVEGFDTACTAPTKENVEAMLRFQHEKESRTCTVWANSYEQVFTQQGPDVWVHNSPPAGLCGVINIATLEREAGAGSLWNYRMRKIVTDKNAVKDTAVFSCKSLDESEYLYTWNSAEYYKGCDYIKYGF